MQPICYSRDLMASFLILVGATATNAATDPVLDLNKTPLRTDAEYFILPVFRGRGGGVSLSSRTTATKCPLDVVQEQLEVSSGLPVKFLPVNTKKGVIRLSTDLNVKFIASTICVQSTVWKLGELDNSLNQRFVTTNGVEGNPGKDTISNWFKIEKFENDYKFLFCPTVCDFCKVICRDVGVFIGEDGRRRLALSDVPFRVMFKKVK